MESISKKITSRPGFSKAILVIREKIVCFKEGKKLLSGLVMMVSIALEMSEVIAMGR